MTAISLTRPVRISPWLLRVAPWAIVGTLNCYAIAWSFVLLAHSGGQTDWAMFRFGAEQIAAGLSPYVEINPVLHHAFRWSPFMAWAFVPLIQLPFIAWIAAHYAALLAFRNWKLAVLIAISWPFVIDMADGGVMIFVALAAYWAWKGNRWGIVAFLILAILIPRPIMLPLLAWILWKRPAWRIPFIVAVLTHAGAVVALGWHVEWAERLLASGDDIANPFNYGPSRWIGAAWIPVGLTLGAWLTWKGRIGWASLAVSPYLLPPYLLMLLLEEPDPFRQR
jgi:hypothetical protein